MRRALLLVVALVVGACGDDATPAERTLSDAVSALEDVRRGTLRFKVAAATTAEADRETGFEVKGPFALAENEGALPEVRLTLTDLLGRESQSAVFASDGEQATVTRGGRTTTLDDEDVAHLRGRAEAEDGLLRLRVHEWARSPRLSGGRVVSEVDVVAALNDVLAVAADVGADPQSVDHIEGDDADRLRRSVRSSRLEVSVDEDTDVPRQVRLVVTFGVQAKDDLTRVLGRLAGVRLAVEMDLDHVELRRDR